MKLTETSLPEVLLVEPEPRTDDRGAFVELFHAERFASAGLPGAFLQYNLSRSQRGVLRGLHFQEPRGQAKLVRVIRGAIFDVAVDVRRGSPRFGRFFAVELAEPSWQQVFIPAGFAHGFLALADDTEVSYQCTALYAPDCERAVAWNDPDLAIPWPAKHPRLSPRDAAAPRLAAAPILPSYPNR